LLPCLSTPALHLQINLRDAVRGTVSFQDERTGKQYALKEVRQYSAVQRWPSQPLQLPTLLLSA
jgi:malate synthase